MVSQDTKALVEELKNIRKELAHLNRSLDELINSPVYCPSPIPDKDKDFIKAFFGEGENHDE